MGFWGNLVRKFVPGQRPPDDAANSPAPTPMPEAVSPSIDPTPPAAPVATAVSSAPAKSAGLTGWFKSWLPRSVEEEIDWEALLIEADLGLTLTDRLVTELKRQRLLKRPAEAEAFIRAELARLVTHQRPLTAVSDRPEVILLLGVNGSGKTTTTAKLAAQAQRAGRSVLLGAADTFRAAAVDQLQVWGERLGVPVVSAPQGTDPASVAFRACDEAVKQGMDLVLIDTAGRLPNKNNLMLEIAKVRRTVEKRLPGAPHHLWLVVDGTTGNNVLSQAHEFHKAVGLTGMIMTKLDSSAKGGMIAAVQAELALPTYYLGRGERVEDLEPFQPQRYVEEFFAD